MSLEIRPHLPGLYQWSGKVIISPSDTRSSILRLADGAGNAVNLQLNYEGNLTHLGTKISVSCPYVVVNLTGFPLIVRKAYFSLLLKKFFFLFSLSCPVLFFLFKK